MKQFVLFIGMLLFTMSYASASYAWTVTITNNCNKDIDINVIGEHLFWESVDCTVSVKRGTTATCKMPKDICPKKIEGTYLVDISKVDLYPTKCNATDLCCCWDVKYQISNDSGGCRAERQ